MKKNMILALTFLSFQAAFADVRERGPIGADRPRDRDDLPMCLKNLENANRNIVDLQSQLSACMEDTRRGPGRGGERENEELKKENRRLNDLVVGLSSDNKLLSDNVSKLTYDNNKLLNDNNRLFTETVELRRQIDDLQNERNGHRFGVFSYAGCKDYTGNIDLSYIVSAEGFKTLEAETNAKLKVTEKYSCNYGIIVGKSEEIRFTEAKFYCVAGCKDYTGNVDQKYIKSATGRNKTEAEFKALKAVTGSYSCNYGIKIQACE